VSARATFWAWEQSLKSSQKLALLALANCHNKDTNQCNPSLQYLCKATGLDRKTVISSLGKLEELQLINTVKRFGVSNKYQILTSTEIGTSTNLGTTQKRDGGSTQNGTRPVPKTVHKPITNLKGNLKPIDPLFVASAERMFTMILDVAPKTKKPDFDKWADEIRKMVELDKHTPKEIAKVFEWANNDNFWRINILSPSKLRQKFSQLHAKMGNQHEINKPNVNNRTETKLERISRQADEIFADATNH
jgi:hypothetical protein